MKFERSRRYRDRYRCHEKKSRRARDPVFRDPPPRRERALDRCSRLETHPPPPIMHNEVIGVVETEPLVVKK